MFLKGLIKFASYTLMIGVCIILGFLSFTGIYVLAPILPLAIAAFILSVIYEGEIYYQNITNAIKGFRNPKYLESKVAEDCLLEIVEDMQNYYDDIFSVLDELNLIIDELGDDKVDNEKLLQRLQKAEELITKIENTETKEKLQSLLISRKTAINNYISQREIINYKPKSGPGAFGKQISVRFNEQLINEINRLITDIHNSREFPDFFTDYAYIAKIGHAYSHRNLNSTEEAKSQNIQLSLAMMEKVFAEQLFPSQLKDKKSTQILGPAEESKDNKNPEAIKNKLDFYKENLREYLVQNGYVEKYEAILNRKRPWSRFNKAIAAISGVFMVLGTSYLLVEAFTVIPLLSSIPFAILPAIVVPLAVIAGGAYGVVTYHALDEMLNSDVITSRIDKIKQEIKDGLSLYTGAKLVGFTLLLVLAITLTICTGGTWFHVIKHGRPIFAWMKNIPTAIAGFFAGILAVGTLGFNVSNSAQTSTEIEEMVESNPPEDHPYNIDLLVVPEGQRIEDSINFVDRTAIIKQGDEYFIHCCDKTYKERNKENWKLVKVDNKSYFLKYLIKRLDFSKNILYFSITNSALYSRIRANTQHKFHPSKENWTQFLNPIRMFLLVTYVPLRILLFLGHLVSISATADRVPGIPEIITMFIGFVAELFEDLHYFTGFQHAHKPNLAGIVEERLKEGGGHDHGNDMPTRILRDYLFVPFFWAAAKWHSYFSDRKETNATDKHLETPSNEPSVSYEDAYEQMRGMQPKSAPTLEKSEKNTVTAINEFIAEEVTNHKGKILDNDDLVEIAGTEDELLRKVIFEPGRPARISSLGVFAAQRKCGHIEHAAVARNTLILQH